MKKEVMTGWKIREEYKKGRKDFSNTEIQWADFSGTDLSGANFSGSRFSVVTFYACNLKNANFSNCDMYGMSFNSANLANAKFDKSKMNWIRFDNAIFENTSMKNAQLNHVTMINCNVSEMKLDGTSQFSVFHKAEEIPDSEIQALIAEIGNTINAVDLDRKLWLRTTLGPYLKTIGKQQTTAQAVNTPYQKTGLDSSNLVNLYHGLDSIFSELIETYGAKNPYKKEGAYKQKGEY